MQREKKTRFVESPKKAQCHREPLKHRSLSPRPHEGRHSYTKSAYNIHNHDRTSHTSVYFTPEPDIPANDKHSSKNRKKHRTKRIGIHIGRNCPNPRSEVITATPNYARKGPPFYDPVTHSEHRAGSSSDSISSNNQSGDLARKKIVIYNPVKRSCSQESAGRYATQFKQRLADDKKCGEEMKISLKKSPRKKSSPVRKNVYKPIGKKDTCLQTDSHISNINKECQASQEPSDVTKCCRGEQCDLLKPYNIEENTCHAQNERHELARDHHKKKRTSHAKNIPNTGHIFPFVGQSPSGTLKIAPQMVSYESKNVSVLIANPSKTRLRHQEYQEDKSQKSFNSARKNHLGYETLYSEQNPVPKNHTETHHSHHKRKSSRSHNKSCPDDEVSQDLNDHSKAKCHREQISKPHHESNERNYAQEMRAWAASKPFFKPEGTADPSKSNLNPPLKKNIEENIESKEFKDNGRSDLTHGTLERSRILGGSGRQSQYGLFAEKTSPPPAPKVPPFPRETSPGGSSFITQSQAFTSDTDGETSYQTSNPKNVKIKTSRGTVDFMENLHYRVKRAIHPDTKVIIGNKEFPVHSVALQIHSKYFDNLKRPYEALHMVELPESIVSPDDFQHVMDWVLTDENDRKLVLTRDNVVGLYSTAQYLVIPDLKAQCLKFVQEKVDSEDPKLIKLWEEAHLKPKTKELVAMLSQKLTTLFPKLYKTRQFLKLDVNELVTLLDSENVVIDSEMDIFDASVRWLLYDWSNRKRHTVKVMSTIRFGLLTPLQLTQMRYLSEDNDAPDFKKIFGFDSVKKMLEDGLTYAILKQSYGKRSGELNKWIKNTGVVPPKPRLHLDSETENQQRSPDLNFDVMKSDAMHAGKEVLGQLKSLDLKSLGKTVMENVQKVTDKISALSKTGDPSENEANPEKEFDKNNSASPAKQSLLLLPDIPYTEHPSVDNVENEGSGENLDTEQKHNEIRAAITIQSQFRGFIARKKVEKMKIAATRIQTALRSFRSRTRNGYRPLKEPSGIKSLAPPDPASSLPYMIQNLDVPKNALLVFGGADPKLPLGPNNTGRDIYMYTVDANVWMHVGRMPEPRTHFGLARIDNDVFIVGGTDPRYKTSNERNIAVKSVWKSNLRHGEWNYDPESPKDLSSPRSHFGCVENDGIIYVIGGNDVDSRALSTCERYDKTYNSWTPMAPLDGPRLSMGISIFEDHIWVAGGVSKNVKMPVLKSVLCYDIHSNSWTAVRSLPLPRAFFTLVTVNDRLYLLGGAGQREKKSTKQSSLPDVLLYDKDNQKWQEIGVLNTARHGHVSAAIGQNIIVLGGVNSTQMGAISSVEILDLSVSHSRKGRSLRQKMSGMGVLPLN